MISKPMLTRKDIAVMIGKCARTVANNEKKWGLDKARAAWGTSRIFYRHSAAVRILVSLGFIE